MIDPAQIRQAADIAGRGGTVEVTGPWLAALAEELEAARKLPNYRTRVLLHIGDGVSQLSRSRPEGGPEPVHA